MCQPSLPLPALPALPAPPVCRVQVCEALTAISEAVGPTFVMAELHKRAAGNKNPKVRVSCLLCMLRLVCTLCLLPAVCMLYSCRGGTALLAVRSCHMLSPRRPPLPSLTPPCCHR